jgi:hypothetical protein
MRRKLHLILPPLRRGDEGKRTPKLLLVLLLGWMPLGLCLFMRCTSSTWMYATLSRRSDGSKVMLLTPRVRGA